MPTYKIINPQTGEVLRVTGDKVPTQQDAAEIFASRTTKTTTNQQNPNLLQSIYNLGIRPTVEGTKSYSQLVGAGLGTILGKNLSESVELNTQQALKEAEALKQARLSGDTEQAKKLAELSRTRYNTTGQVADIAAIQGQNILENVANLRQQTGLEGSFDQGLLPGLKTVGIGTLKGLAGVGAATDLFLLGTAGTLTGATRVIAREFVRNALVNSGLYGTGEAIKAAKEGGDITDAFINGLSGNGTTGIFEGLVGDSDVAKAADIALSIGLPLLLGKQIDKATNKIVSIGENGAKTAVNMVKSGSSKLVKSNLKQALGDRAYQEVVDDINASVNSTKSQRSMMDKAGTDIGEEYLTQGLSGKFDKQSINSDISYLSEQNKLLEKELLNLAENSGTKNFFTKTDFDDLLYDLQKSGKYDAADLRHLQTWFDDIPNKNLTSMEDVLEAERLAGSKAFSKTQTQLDNVKADAYGELYHRLREVVTSRLEGSDNIFKQKNANYILINVLQNTKVSTKPLNLERKIGKLFSPRTLAQQTIGKGVESIVKKVANKTSVPSRIQQSPAGIRQSALQNILNETKSQQTPQLSSLRTNPLEGIKSGL